MKKISDKFHFHHLLAVALLLALPVMMLLTKQQQVFNNHAAGSLVAVEAENGTVNSGATIINDTAASGQRALQFAAAVLTPGATNPSPSINPNVNCTTQVWQNLEACGWPGPTNTGYPAGTTFTNTSGRTITTAGTVINGEKISGRVYIAAQNVTIKNSWIISTGGGTNGTGVIEIQPGASATIDHVTIDGGNNAHACIWHAGASMTVTAVNCSNVNDGIFSWQDTGGTTQGNNFTIQDTYIHTLTEATGNGHIDGYQTEGANNGVIRHNTIDIDKGQNAAVSVWDSYKSSDNILVENNLLTGGGFTVYAEDYSPSEANPAGGFTLTNVQFNNNKFSTVHFGCVGQYGVWYTRGSPSDGWKRTGNTIIETGQNIDNTNPSVNGQLCT